MCDIRSSNICRVDFGAILMLQKWKVLFCLLAVFPLQFVEIAILQVYVKHVSRDSCFVNVGFLSGGRLFFF